MKTLMIAGLISSLFFSAQISRAQSREVPPDFLLHEQEMINPADAYGYDVLTRADQMIQANDKDGALFLLTENFDRFTRLRAMIFAKKLDVFLAQGNIQEARNFYLQYAKNDQELARAGIDQIYSYYVRKGDNRAIIDWTGELLTLPLPGEVKPQVFSWHLNAVCTNGVTSEVRALVKDCVSKFNPETCLAILNPAVVSFIGGGKYDDATRLLDMIEKEGKGIANLQSMVVADKARIIFLQKRWKEGEAFFMKRAAGFSDGDLAGFISFAASKAQKKEDFEAVDRMSMFIIKNQKKDSRAANEAAACALNMLKLNKKPAEIPARLEQLAAMGMPVSTLYPLYSEYFYTVILLEDKDLTKQMLAFGGKLNEKINNSYDNRQMALLLMDGFFTIGDYERSLQIIDANTQYWQKNWQESAKVKIGAHLALQKKNYKEAIEGFRKYMDCVAKDNEMAFNPVTEQIYTPEMLLGFNALRIGDILRDNLKDEDGARKAYDEAEQYFKKAAAARNVRPNSKESEYINEQMNQIALRKKK